MKSESIPRVTAVSFAKRMYLPRVLGSCIGSLAIAAVFIAQPTSIGWWVLLIFHGFLWPHLAYGLANRVAVPYLVERRNLMAEAVFGGLYVAAMQFNSLPSIMLASMLAMNSMAVGGPRLLRTCIALLAAACLASTAIFGFGFIPDTTALQVYACLPMLAFYPIAVAGAAHRLAAQLAEHKRGLREISRVDGLTGLLNQEAWRDTLEAEFMRIRKRSASSSLALIDIDFFKSINDVHGHSIGDDVIRLFSSVLQKEKRSSDVAGRVGGDEFGLLLRDTDAHQAEKVLSRLQRALADSLAARPDLPSMTLSIGIVKFDPAMASARAWIDACDVVLYRAKGQGRNQIALH